jgi:hypothetical protein
MPTTTARLPAQPSFYRPSGRFSAVSLVVTLLTGVTVAAVLGVFYALLIYVSPFVYLNFLAVAGYAVVLGVMMAKLGDWLPMRAPAIATLLGGVVGLTGLYVSWVTWLLAATEGSAGLLTNPIALVGAISVLADHGVWSIVGVTPTGLALYALWVTEAVVLVGVPAWATRAAARAPFCEGCRKWTVNELARTWHGGWSQAELLAAATAGRMEALCDADPHRGGYARATLESCPDCQTTAFLTAEHLTFSVDKDGEVKERATPVFTHLAIAPLDLAQARAVLGDERQSTTDLESPPAHERVSAVA